MNAKVSHYIIILIPCDFRKADFPPFPTIKHIKMTWHLLHYVYQEDFFQLIHFHKTRTVQTIFKLPKNHSQNKQTPEDATKNASRVSTQQ